MSRVLVLVASVSVLGLVGGLPLGAQTCDPDGDVKFVCGTTNPEDLYEVPGDWVIASGRYSDSEGPVYAVSLRDHSVREIFPAGGLPPEHDRDTYGACPGPNDVFQPHGLTLRVATATCIRSTWSVMARARPSRSLRWTSAAPCPR